MFAISSLLHTVSLSSVKFLEPVIMETASDPFCLTQRSSDNRQPKSFFTNATANSTSSTVCFTTPKA